MAWVRPRNTKPIRKDVDRTELKRSTLRYFSCGHRPQNRSENRLKASDLILLGPKRQRPLAACPDESDPLLQTLAASQKQTNKSKQRGGTRCGYNEMDDELDVVEVEEHDSFDERHESPRLQRRIVTAPARHYPEDIPATIPSRKRRDPVYQAKAGPTPRPSYQDRAVPMSFHPRPTSRWSSAVTPLQL
ncbi:MAG: hypothetical protein Q9181_003382 [Wetmoreana brouardii]